MLLPIKTICKKYYSEWCSWKAHPWEIFGLIMALILAYGFKVTHVSYNNDMIYNQSSLPLGAIQQPGRWGITIFTMIGLADCQVQFWYDIVGLIFFVFAGFALRVFIVERAHRLQVEIPSWTLTLCVCLFLTFPLHMEILCYPFQMITIPLGYLFVFLSLSFTFMPSRLSLIYASGLLTIAGTLYESFFVAYLTGFISGLLIQCFFSSREKPLMFCAMVEAGLRSLLVGILALLIRFGVMSLIGLIYPYRIGNVDANKGLIWVESKLAFGEKFIECISRIFYAYFYNGLFYLPVAIFVLAGCFVFVLPLLKASRGNRFLTFLLSGSLYLSCFAFPLLQGCGPLYRNMQSISIFVSIIFMLALTLSRHRCFFGILVVWVILLQTKEVSLWTFADWRASEWNIARIREMAHDVRKIQETAEAKTVVVVGGVKDELPQSFSLSYFDRLTKRLPRLPYTSESCAMAWFADSNPGRLLIQYVTGLRVEKMSSLPPAILDEVNLCVSSQPSWPQSGYIRSCRKVVVINLDSSDSEWVYASAKKLSPYHDFWLTWRKIKNEGLKEGSVLKGQGVKTHEY